MMVTGRSADQEASGRQNRTRTLVTRLRLEVIGDTAQRETRELAQAGTPFVRP